MVETKSLYRQLKHAGIKLPVEVFEHIRKNDVKFAHQPNSIFYIAGFLEKLTSMGAEGLARSGDKKAFVAACEAARAEFLDECFRWKQLSRADAMDTWQHYSKFRVFGQMQITRENNPRIYSLVEEACKETKSKMPDEILMLDTDIPNAIGRGKNLENRVSTLFLTSDVIRILNPLELKALIGHELNEIEATSKNKGINFELENVASRLGISRFAHKRELQADRRGALTEGGAEAMISALQKIDARNDEIIRFVDQADEAARGAFRTLLPGKSKTFEDLFPEYSEKEAGALSKAINAIKTVVMAPVNDPSKVIDTHPTTSARIKNLKNVPSVGR